MVKFKLDPTSPTGIATADESGYQPYFAGGPGKPSLIDSVNGKHGAVQITGGNNVTVDNTGTGIVISSSGGSGATDATTTSKGIVQLAGDLAGTAAAPTVPGLATKESSITAGTTSQYWRGDKSWQTLDKTAVGLPNVDNTADVNKAVLSAGKLTTSRAIDGVAFDGSADISLLAPATHAATSKVTPVDADEIPITDSAASFVLKKLTWANLKATIKSYYDSVVSTVTNKDLTSGTNTFPTFNQSTTGSAAKWTTPRTLAGNSVDGSANVAFANKVIVQGTVDAGLSAAQFLGALGTGLLKNTTTTGVLSVALAGTDYVAPGGALGTPSSGTATNLTGLPIATGVSGLGTGVAAFLATPTSANLATALTDETGTGANVFATSPSLTTPTIGSAGANLSGSTSGTTVVKAAAIASGTLTLPAATDTLVGKATTDVFTNKDLTSTTNIFPTGSIVQVVSANFSAVATGTTLIPTDDTIPQITEGTEFMTLAITPKATTNILVVEATFFGGYSVVERLQIALFQDATANALAGAANFVSTANTEMTIPLRHRMAAGTTSATTFRIRAGANAAGTVTFNGTAGTRRFGGITMSNMTITEIKA